MTRTGSKETETSAEANALDFLRHRVRLVAALASLGAVLLALTDPLVAPHALGPMYALKVALIAAYVWLWRFAGRTASHTAVCVALSATMIFAVLIMAPSTIWVGVGWHSLLMAGVLGLGTAAAVPWGLRAQIWLVAGMLPFALIPLAVLGADESAAVPILVSVCCLLLSIVSAWQNERHAISVERSLDSFRENVERLQQLTEHIHAVFWLIGSDGSILYVSPRFQDVWGRDPVCLQQRSDAWLDAVHPSDRGTVDAWLRSGALRGHGGCEYRLVSANGGIRWIRDQTFPIKRAQGGVWRIARVSWEVTAEREAERAASMQQVARSVQSAVEEDRKRIAREMHDELGQALTGVKLLLASIDKPAGRQARATGKVVQACIGEIDKAMRSVHAMIHTIRPPALDDLGLVAALRSQTDAFTEHTGIRCDIDLPDDDIALSPEETTTVFRVAQEALTNVARHARATHVGLRLAVRSDRVELLVEDDGQGVAALKEDFGVRGMRERAALLSGSFEVEPRADRGTVVRLQLPRSTAATSMTALPDSRATA